MTIEEQINDHKKVIDLFEKGCIPVIRIIAEECLRALENGHKILICGNGGSAADSQHIAAEFVGRFHKERISLPAIALTVDTSILTAVGNDYSYDLVFKRQVEGLGNKGDVLIGISTSGNSQNVIAALEEAKKKGLYTVAFTGMKDSKCSELADVTLQVPSTVTARIQECHILAAHIICNYVDEAY